MQVQDASGPVRSRREGIFSIVLLLAVVAALFVYKADGGLTRLRQVSATGALPIDASALFPQQPLSDQNVVARSLQYLRLIGPAFFFGILIAGAVRTFVSPAWIARVIARGSIRQHVAAGISGAPLMLCSCCVAPVFSAVYERSTRLGPSLALALAAPSLNPIALTLTFMLFQPSIAIARLVMALAVVFLVAPAIGRLSGRVYVARRDVHDDAASAIVPGLRAFLASCVHVAVRTVPLLLGGVLFSMWIADSLPVTQMGSGTVGLAAAVAVASLVAVPLAMPTFFEIPIALTLAASGAPAGAVAAVLLAGPAINLPSLLTIGRATNWKVASLVAAAVAGVASIGGFFLIFLLTPTL